MESIPNMIFVVNSAYHAIELIQASRQSTQSLSWTDFFSQELFLPEEINGIQIIHHAYLTPPSEPGPLFVMHHGAGSSGLSFATCADELRKLLPKAGVLSIDARSHGRTAMTPKSKLLSQDNPSTGLAAQVEADGKIEHDLSLDTLSRDLVFVIRETQARMGWENLPDIVLVGHSLGGAVITDVAKKGELGSKLLAYAVLDVVEGNSGIIRALGLLVLNSFDRIRYGCPPKYGELSLHTTNPIPFTNIRNRVAVSLSLPYPSCLAL
jgi:pimeloyl-ACP methyl ester carboxylesterase